jgi:hypothetical protein
MTPKTPRRAPRLQLLRGLLFNIGPDLVVTLAWILALLVTTAPALKAINAAAGLALGFQLARLEAGYQLWRNQQLVSDATAQLRALAEVREALARTAP